jgi:hypothetical protein
MLLKTSPVTLATMICSEMVLQHTGYQLQSKRALIPFAARELMFQLSAIRIHVEQQAAMSSSRSINVHSAI